MNTLLNKISVLTATSTVLSAVIATGTANPAQAISFNFNWQGDAGYSATGMFSYDETTAPTIIAESGAGSTNNLESLMVSFFDPSGSLLQSFNTVTDGVSESPFFEFNFDTSTQTLFGNLDIGGGTGVIGELFFSGTVGSSLVLRQDVDQIATSIELDRNSGEITVSAKTSVPEPASVLGLLAFGAMGAGSLLKKKQA